MSEATQVTAAVLVIGDEILFGPHEGSLTAAISPIISRRSGLTLKEIRVVGDVEDEIVSAVNALREKYDYLFTTGGIGPTHDDITADARGEGVQRGDL